MAGWTLPLLLLVIPLQVFSHATTCNQGSVDAFVFGSLSTLPLLLIIGAMLVASLARVRPDPHPTITASVIGGMMLSAALVIDADIWSGALLHGTPCPGFWDDPETQANVIERVLVVVAYLVLPVVNILLFAALSLRSLRGPVA